MKTKNETPEFTIEQAIEIQAKQLAEWKRLLKTKIYNDLHKWATEKNHLKENGYEVKRGSDLSHFVSNYFNAYTPTN